MTRVLALGAIAITICAGCAAALMVVFGEWDRLAGQPLGARVLVHEIRVPSSYAIDPTNVADELVRRMQVRSERDMALRVMLGEEMVARVRDRVLPRLLNAGVLRRMIVDMDGLGTVIAFSGYRSWGRITVTNAGPAPLEDVAITLPHASRAEMADGASLEVRDHGDELSSVTLGRLEAGGSVGLAVWFEQAPEAVTARGADIRLGADGGVRGTVRLYDPTHGWNGAELENQSWARWLIAGVLAAVGFAAFAAVVLLAVGLVRPRRLSRA